MKKFELFFMYVEQLIEQMVEQAEQLENAEGDPVGNNGSQEGSVSGESGKKVLSSMCLV